MQSLKELPKALVKARLKFKKITKNKEGYGYKYADLGELFDATQEALAEEGIVVLQVPITPQPNLVGIRTEIWHVSGEMLSYEFVPDLDVKTVGTQKGVQALGSLISYLKRYHYAAIFGLASEDDDGKDAVEQFHSKPKSEAVKQLKISEEKDKLIVEIRALYSKVPETKRNQICNNLQFSWTEITNFSVQELKEIKEALNAK
jgi:hypothetical protein